MTEWARCTACGTRIIVGEDCPNYGNGEFHAPVSPANRVGCETGETTIDEHPLILGMKVWDYNLEPAYVQRVDHVAADGTTWYRTTRSPDGTGHWDLFDAKRMWRYHPSTGALA